MKKILIPIVILIIIIFASVFNFYFANYDNSADKAREREVFVYETPAESSDECTSYEYFDEDNSVCYFECEDENECREIEKSIDEELASWADSLDDLNISKSEGGERGQAEKVLASYNVNYNEKLSLKTGDNKKEFVEIWNNVAKLSPDSLTNNYINEFNIYEEENSDVLAYVLDENSDGKWLMSINLPTYNELSLKEKNMTLVHELAHIISLNTSQININQDCVKKNILSLDEGCSLENSFINNFWKSFWQNKNTKYADNNFVSEYASTDVVEDFAESFTYFVLSNNRVEKEGGKKLKIKDEKINFFFDQAELVSIKNEMRNNLSKEIIRARKSS